MLACGAALKNLPRRANSAQLGTGWTEEFATNQKPGARDLIPSVRALL
jgi:hypothetical protein